LIFRIKKEVLPMLYEDNFGRLLMPSEVDELSPYEIEEKGIHIFNGGEHYPEFW
jgi:hypothetical protein